MMMSLTQRGRWLDLRMRVGLGVVLMMVLTMMSSSWVNGQDAVDGSKVDGDDVAVVGVEGEAVEVLVEVAHLTYGATAQTSVCFSSGYLDLLRRETNILTASEPVYVEAGGDDLFKYPFVVMTGEGDFVLSEKEIVQLRHYLGSGGFILASGGCSNAAWDVAFRREFKRMFGARELELVPLVHEIFHIVFEIDQLRTRRQSAAVELFGLQFDGRVGLIYSAEGLNDTGNAGGGCCCCGGNEIRNAKYLNANFLAYALTK